MGGFLNGLWSSISNGAKRVGGMIQSGLDFAYALPGAAAQYAQNAGAQIRAGYGNFSDTTRQTANQNPPLGLVGGIDNQTLLIIVAIAGVAFFALSQRR